MTARWDHPPLAPKPARPRRARTPGSWRCHSCGAIFTAWAAAERHADEHAHHRVECVLVAP